MNALLEKVIEARNGHYCHIIEVSEVSELEMLTECIFDENSSQFDNKTIIDFLETLEVYCLNEANEYSVFAFNFRDYANSLIY